MNQKILKFGSGTIAVTGGVQVPDVDTAIALFMLEEDKGTGEIGASVPERPAGMAVFPETVNGVIFEFPNLASVDVVLEQLAHLRGQFSEALVNPGVRREYFEKSEAAINTV